MHADVASIAASLTATGPALSLTRNGATFDRAWHCADSSRPNQLLAHFTGLTSVRGTEKITDEMSS